MLKFKRGEILIQEQPTGNNDARSDGKSKSRMDWKIINQSRQLESWSKKGVCREEKHADKFDDTKVHRVIRED